MNVKVSDFGLARVLEEGKDYYRMGQGCALPVRWMAPESITDLLFTTESDVVSDISFHEVGWSLIPSICLSACLFLQLIKFCPYMYKYIGVHVYSSCLISVKQRPGLTYPNNACTKLKLVCD